MQFGFEIDKENNNSGQLYIYYYSIVIAEGCVCKYVNRLLAINHLIVSGIFVCFFINGKFGN